MNIDENLIEEEMFTPDEIGMIFFFDKRVFRGINESHINHVKEIFDCGLMIELIEKELFPKTFFTDYKTNNYKLILEHEKIGFMSYCFEWSFNMMKDAALLVLNVEAVANKYGYHLKDPHAYNVVYKNNKPIYIDLGSFVKGSNDLVWIGRQDYIYSFYIPLFLITKGYSKLGSILMYQYNYLTANEYLTLIHPLISILPNKIRKLLIQVDKVSNKTDISIERRFQSSIPIISAKFIRDFINTHFGKNYFNKKILNMERPLNITTTWQNYNNDIDPAIDARMYYIGNEIKNLEGIESCLEIGANQGLFANYILEITNIPHYIAVDFDEGAIDKMYMNNINNPRLQVVLSDPLTPDMSDYYAGFSKRFKSDLVIGMAITHHLILSQNLNIKYIFRKFHEFTNIYLIVEFMPFGLYYGDDNNIPPIPDFYTESWFISNLKEFFEITSRNHVEKNRIVFTCKKN